MNNPHFKKSIIFLFCFLAFHLLQSQNIISGIITDQATNESVIGAEIKISGTGIGTTSDLEGRFSLSTDYAFPITIEIEAFDYESVAIVLEEQKELILITMRPEEYISDEVVISASRIEERIMESPVSIEKYGLLKIREAAGSEILYNLGNLKGIQVNASSISFNSVNTRGFSDAQNWRFVQMADGVEMNSPGLNYSLGNLIGPLELDIRNIEIVPGPGSALYGPNAFNGTMVMNSKNPFDYQGLSVKLKGGFTTQDANGSNPFGDFSMRFARKFNEKLAVKLSVGYFTVTDWAANDDSYHITQQNFFNKSNLLNLPREHPNYNAVNTYGDEIVVPVLISADSVINVNRSGIKESDLIDYSVNNLKLFSSIHFRPREDAELIYDVRFVQGDAILRHTTVYPMRDVRQLINKIEWKADGLNLKAYHSYEDANNSYAILGMGAFIQEGLKSSANWSQDYGAAFRGEIPGVAAQDHLAARLFADRDALVSNNTGKGLFNNLREQSLNNPDILTGGAQFIDKSSFFHAEANYDFRDKIKIFDLQEGISYRRYSLVSEGNLFNDGEAGFNGPIPIEEYSAYAQISKKVWQDKLAFRGSLRLDKNQNFEARVSPRGSMTLTLGKERQHNFRFSGQTGFRNPASQETYIALDIGNVVIIGGTEDNISNYTYVNGEGQAVPGIDLYRQLMTPQSVQAFLASGGTNPEVLELSRLDFLRQEKISTVELGYKGLINKRLFIDINGYFNQYKDFVTREVGYSLLANRAFAVYTNVPDEIYSWGGGVQIEYLIKKGFKVWGNYSFAEFDAEEVYKNNPGFFPGFNTPKHRFNITASNRDIYKGIGATVSFRWSDSYLWQSPFGEGEIEAYSVLDAALYYRIASANSILKIGGTNLLNKEYRLIYGGPNIGSQFYMSLTFDELSR